MSVYSYNSNGLKWYFYSVVFFSTPFLSALPMHTWITAWRMIYCNIEKLFSETNWEINKSISCSKRHFVTILKAGCRIWLYQFLIIAYLFTLLIMLSRWKAMSTNQYNRIPHPAPDTKRESNTVSINMISLTHTHIHNINMSYECRQPSTVGRFVISFCFCRFLYNDVKQFRRCLNILVMRISHDKHFSLTCLLKTNSPVPIVNCSWCNE